MSPSDRDDGDRHIMPGPPWVRPDPSRDDSYRDADDDVSEPLRLDQSFRPLPKRARPQYRDDDGHHEFPETRFSRPDGRRHDGGLPTLEPVVMPPPPQEKMRLPRPGIIIKLGGAVLVAACAALAMMNAVQTPATGVAAAVENQIQSSATPVFGSLTEIASAQAKALETSEPRPRAVDAFIAATSGSAVEPRAGYPRSSAGETSGGETPLGETPLRGTLPRGTPPRETSLARETSPAREASLGDAPLRQMPESFGEGASRPEAVARAVPVPEERHAVTPMPRDEISALLKRGRGLIAAGDIASARLILTRLAEAGSMDACLALAGTFDASVLADMHVVGVHPDPAKARAWYLKAAEQGSPEARRRLQQSSVR